MSIYEKLARIQKKLMNMEIPKSGRNNFQKYNYYELEDLLPPIFEACFEEELTLIFNFTEDAAVLHLKSWKANPEVNTIDEIRVRAPFPDLAANKGRDNIQTEGAYITYLKRYLLINLFLIMENDVVDSNVVGKCECKENKTAAKSKAPAKTKAKDKKVTIPRFVKNASRLCKKTYGNITEDGIIEKLAELRSKGLIDSKEHSHLEDYAKANFDDIVRELA